MLSKDMTATSTRLVTSLNMIVDIQAGKTEFQSLWRWVATVFLIYHNPNLVKFDYITVISLRLASLSRVVD
jgi:hypothetical protein